MADTPTAPSSKSVWDWAMDQIGGLFGGIGPVLIKPGSPGGGTTQKPAKPDPCLPAWSNLWGLSCDHCPGEMWYQKVAVEVFCIVLIVLGILIVAFGNKDVQEVAVKAAVA